MTWLTDHLPAIVGLSIFMAPFALGLFLLIRDARRAVRDPYEQDHNDDLQDRDWRWPHRATLAGHMNEDAGGAVTPRRPDHGVSRDRRTA